MDKKQEKIKNFLRETEKLKQVKRKTYLSNRQDKEDAAQHSWELVLMALTLEEYLPKGASLLKILKILAVHDLVEIDCGDTYAFDSSQKNKKSEKEKHAAKRLFKILPAQKGREFLSLWREYEEGSSIEARVAKVIDRTAPIAQFNASKKIDKEFRASSQECYDYAIGNLEEFPDLKRYFKAIIKEAVRVKGDKVDF
ncbi:MAG: HD domain-containing protein [Candidatus Moranbacteria bacterium]|nr:HD domain-containing protein [Candidatus Moranbacteria bacterium]